VERLLREGQWELTAAAPEELGPLAQWEPSSPLGQKSGGLKG